MSNFWSDLSNAIGNDLTSVNGGKPSVITNLLKQRQWNANLPGFGGITSPLPEKVNAFPQQAYAQQPVKAVQGAATKAARPYMPSPTPTSASYPVDFNKLETPMNSYEQKTYDTFKKAGIHPAVAYGIAAAENGSHNRFNIGAYDSNPTAAPMMDDLQSASTAAKMLSGQASPNFYANGIKGKKAFSDAYAKRDNPDAYLQGIQDAGYAGDPKTWKQRSASTGGAGKYYDSWSQFIKSTPAWQKWYGQ